MAVNVEIWHKAIAEVLFADLDFLQHLTNADEYVIGGSVVHKPQAANLPGHVKNPTSFPLTANLRADGDITYAIHQYATLPTHIQDAEKVELSYPKAVSVMRQHMGTVLEGAAVDICYDLVRVHLDATSGVPRLRTSGVATAAHLPSATGNRKKFTKEDLKKARFAMNKQNVSKNDRYALFPSDLLEQLQDDADLIKRDRGAELDMKNGVIDRLYGFNILERTTTVVMDNTATPVAKVPGVAGAATDNDTVLTWQKASAERALGTVKFFERINDPFYLGDVYNCLLRFGGRPSRQDSKGIIAIVQDAA